MNSSAKRLPTMITVFRWAARCIGLLLAALVLVFAVGEGLDPRQLTLITALMAVAFFVAVVGMLALWRWELLGGVLVVAGMLSFYVLNFVAEGDFPKGLAFLVCFLPGILALACAVFSRRKS